MDSFLVVVFMMVMIGMKLTTNVKPHLAMSLLQQGVMIVGQIQKNVGVLIIIDMFVM